MADSPLRYDPSALVAFAASLLERSGIRVDIAHDFRPRLPGFAALVDTAFTRPIAGRTLATFKALAEALASDWAPTTNP